MPPEEIADLAKRRLRQRIPELTAALQRHRMTDHHRWLINQSVEHIVLLDRQLEELETAIQKRIKAWPEQNALLQSIPGIKEMSAASILAEIGPDIGQFSAPGSLCKWAGICPGNNRSAGKNKHGRIQKANKFLITALVEAAWAAARTRDSLFQRRFHRWMQKLGKPKANVALAHSLLRLIWAVLWSKQPFREPDPAQMHAKERTRLLHHHSQRLRQLGADPDLLEQLEQSLAQAPAATPPTALQTPRLRKACSANVRRGALGFRARQTRQQFYSVEKDPSDDHPRRGARKNKTRTSPPAAT
ncbi:MAG: IS110 family transposase [Bryobacteraceae bacterium]|nr:IS110 family transposase [Bryobacteraceae bacterium]